MSRPISSLFRMLMRFSSMRSGSTFRTGFSAHQPRLHAVEKTPLRMSLALFRCRGVSKACLIYSLHSSAEMLRMRRFAKPLHRLMNRLVMPRKSLSVRARRSFLASNASSTARAKVTVFSPRHSARHGALHASSPRFQRLLCHQRRFQHIHTRLPQHLYRRQLRLSVRFRFHCDTYLRIRAVFDLFC